MDKNTATTSEIEWVTVPRLAIMLGLGLSAAKHIARALPRTWATPGGHWRVSVKDAEAYIESRRIAAGTTDKATNGA